MTDAKLVIDDSRCALIKDLWLDIYPKSFMLFRDHQQITFCTLNTFCALSKKTHPLVLNRQYLTGWNTNQN